MTLNLYSFFHLNIGYSAIEEIDRPKVIKKCYWPLLRLASNLNLPIGIELSGYTLEIINKIDPTWVKELRKLIASGQCEIIGCGYSQIIGPLVPSKVTEMNLKIGNKIYQKLLGSIPKIALINEQAFSSGIISNYKLAGYKAIIMEWDNPYREHPEWDSELSYFSQKTKSLNGEIINLIWNKSIGFQKFQRYVHGDLDLDELLDYVLCQISDNSRAYSLYGNDVEIFDFRPGRYMTEGSIQKEGEWNRINKLYDKLKNNNKVKFIKPSEVINLKSKSFAGKKLTLSSPGQPIPVKKQDKYNILRWAVTGRNDLLINTHCWKIYESLNKSNKAKVSDWKELCFLWSSDFRTHITDKRWKKYIRQINKTKKRWHKKDNFLNLDKHKLDKNFKPKKHFDIQKKFTYKQIGRFLIIENHRFEIKLNLRKGMAIESFIDLYKSKKALFGTIDHGYFDDISFGADYYSGHLVFEAPGEHKVTDLTAVKAKIIEFENGLQVSANIKTQLGIIKKKWTIDMINGSLILSYILNWPHKIIGSMRLGNITIMPETFNIKKLSYQVKNGGSLKEKFNLFEEKYFNHGKTVSSLISASQAIGITDGTVSLCDNKKSVNVTIDKSQAALVGLVSHIKIKNKVFSRLSFSAREVDDTSQASSFGLFKVDLKIST